MKALARFVSLTHLLVAATVVVGLCQLGYAYFSRSPAAGCITERAVARHTPMHASFGPGASRRVACSDPDASTRRHWYAVVGGVYAALSIAIVVLVATGDLTRPGPGLLTTEAVAAEPGVMARCAAREIPLITDIERAGETSSVPGEQVYRAFVTMLEARSLCAGGRLDDALALYDSAAALAPVQAAAK